MIDGLHSCGRRNVGVLFHSRNETKIQTVASLWVTIVAKKFKQSYPAGKVMARVFWVRKGILLIDFNSDNYCATPRKVRQGTEYR